MPMIRYDTIPDVDDTNLTNACAISISGLDVYRIECQRHVVSISQTELLATTSDCADLDAIVNSVWRQPLFQRDRHAFRGLAQGRIVEMDIAVGADAQAVISFLGLTALGFHTSNTRSLAVAGQI